MTVAAAIHLIDDRQIEIAAPQKIGVERVDPQIVDGGVSGQQRLPEHLPTEDLRATDIAALAAKQVDFQSLEFELLQQIGEPTIHVQPTPSRFCMTGLVVVYCRNCFFSGYSQLWMPNAARAASWNPERISFFLPG